MSNFFNDHVEGTLIGISNLIHTLKHEVKEHEEIYHRLYVNFENYIPNKKSPEPQALKFIQMELKKVTNFIYSKHIKTLERDVKERLQEEMALLTRSVQEIEEILKYQGYAQAS